MLSTSGVVVAILCSKSAPPVRWRGAVARLGYVFDRGAGEALSRSHGSLLGSGCGGRAAEPCVVNASRVAHMLLEDTDIEINPKRSGHYSDGKKYMFARQSKGRKGKELARCPAQPH